MTIAKPDFFYSIIALGLVTVLGYLGPWNYLFELFNHFRLQLALGAATLLTYAHFVKKPERLAYIVLCASLAINITHVFYGQFTHTAPQPERQQLNKATRFNLYSANILTQNTNYKAVLGQIRDTNPDIVLLLETSQKWLDALTPLTKSHPYHVTYASSDNFGIAFYSRWPFEGDIVKSRTPLPYLSVKIHPPGKPAFSFIGAHVIAGVGPKYHAIRSQQYNEIIKAARAIKGPLVLAGDFNDTVYSFSFATLLEQANLHYGYRPFQLLRSWPTETKRAIFSMGIDHILVRNAFIEQLEKQNKTGSDHYGLASSIAVLPQDTQQSGVRLTALSPLQQERDH